MTTVVQSRLGLDPILTKKTELRPNWSSEDLQQIVRSAYEQVFGRQAVYTSQAFTSAESLLRNGSINVREFIRILAKSDLYKERFFNCNSQVRFIELNYKHLLGRAPYDQSEIRFHVDLYNTQGFEAEIDSYIDSPEYTAAFGDYVVPNFRGFQSHAGMKTVGYNRLFEIYRGPGNSDNAQLGGKDSLLRTKVARNLTNSIRQPSQADSRSIDFSGEKALCGATLEAGRVYRVEALLTANSNAPVRRTKRSYTVSYDRLSATFQAIHRSGGKITSIVPV